MTAPRCYVSHAAADRDRVAQLLRPIRNLPVEVVFAGDEVDPGVRRREREGQLDDADQVLVFLADAGPQDPLVNQEIGFAVAADLPIVPIAPSEERLPGYLEGREFVRYERGDLEETAFRLVSELRDRLEPVGTLATPNWFLTFECSTDGCGSEVRLEVDEPQAVLRSYSKHEELLEAACEDCGATYQFNPLTLGYVRSVARHEQ